MVTLGTEALADEALILQNRKIAEQYLLWACGYPEATAIGENHPRYQIVTEGRDVGAWQRKYSSCGDLPHWLYEWLGVRLPWLNRKGSAGGWRSGANLRNLQAHGYWGANPIAQMWEGQELDAGDTLIVSRPDHSGVHAVCVVAAHDDLINTAQYGQPGGALVDCRITTGERLCTVLPGGGLSAGRIIRCVLHLSDVVVAAAEAGKLVPPCALPSP